MENEINIKVQSNKITSTKVYFIHYKHIKIYIKYHRERCLLNKMKCVAIHFFYDSMHH